MSIFELPTVSREIDGQTYTCKLFTAEVGLGLLERLGPIVGVSLASLPSGDFKGAAETLAQQIQQGNLVHLAKDLLRSVSIGEKKIDVDTPHQTDKTIPFNYYFAGKYGLLSKIAAFVIEVNFPDFFGGIKNALNDFKQGRAGSQSPSPNSCDETGQSSKSGSAEKPA